MTRKKKDGSKSYVPMPTIAEEHVDRYRLVMAAATGQLSVSEAARRVGMSRNHSQTLLHRSEAAVIDVVTPQPAGRKARSQKELERASCHLTDEVRALLDQHGVLTSHGPAHYPCFYGQLERQNREHRALMDGVGVAPDDVHDEVLAAMKDALNDLWHRRTLGWKTAGERWRGRPLLNENRAALREEVDSLAARLERTLTATSSSALDVSRFNTRSPSAVTYAATKADDAR